MPKIMFRCDSSKLTGTGHVTRCFALAEIFAHNGWDVVFCGEFDEPNWILKLLNKLNYLKIEKIDVALKSQVKYDVVVFDSYYFDKDEQNSIAKFGNFIVSIVDEVSEKINANLYISSLPLKYLQNFYNVNNYLFGPEFALVRTEFLDYKKNFINSSKKVYRPKVGIFSGGVAKRELFKILLPQIAPTLKGCDLKLFANKEEIPGYLLDSNHISVIPPSFSFYEHLTDVNFVIATASVSSWEFLCMDIPLSVYGIYENQRNTYEFLKINKYAETIGFTDDYRNLKIDQKALNISLNKTLGKELQFGKQKRVVDGLGANRIYDEILKLI
jgi:spore coat polysaccharide biosynthesis predicted glycosyltransferase SpsG